MKIAISGSAGVGKTTLVTGLSEALGIPRISEEMRDYLVVTDQPLAGRPAAEIAVVLAALWDLRVSRESALPAFVADNSCLDFIAYVLFYRCQHEAAVQPLLTEAWARVRTYDACIVLPFGSIPYVDDGIRPRRKESQRNYQRVLERLYRKQRNATTVHRMPLDCRVEDERLRWALSSLAAPAHREDRGIMAGRS
ncbi:MAG: AAA family ATPase [Elusimicrobia bacterium]|nr:AAA family ATPase [Elusimicrobiota bacterium]